MASGEQGWSWLFGKLYALLSRNPPSNRLVADMAALEPGERVLDIGSGSGAALEAAAQVVGPENVAGADPTGPLADKVRRRLPQAEVVEAGAEDLPFPDDSFDVVWTISAFHHWDDRSAGLAEVLRVLRPGGRILLAERQMMGDGGHGLSQREADRLIETLERTGFSAPVLHQEKAGRHDFLVLVAKKP